MGGPAAVGLGLNPIFKPGGGYYQEPVTTEPHAYGIGRCTPNGPRAYLHLKVREHSRPGGRMGRWFS